MGMMMMMRIDEDDDDGYDDISQSIHPPSLLLL
jgi:hypothetical protein